MNVISNKSTVAKLRKVFNTVGGVLVLALTDAEIESLRAWIVTAYGGNFRNVSGQDFRAKIAELRA
jgi:hypothetical protein